MSDAVIIAIVTGAFGITGKVVDVILTRAKAAEAPPKRKSRRDVINPLTLGGILNPATAILLVVGIVFGVAAATVFNHPAATPPGTPTATETASQSATHDPNVLVKGGQAQIHVTGGDRLLIREQPDFSAKVTARLDDGTVVALLDGPRTVDGDRWWLIQLPNGTTGWAVETFEGINTLQPYSP